MWLFKKRQRKGSENAVADKMASRIAGFALAVQNRVAGTMNKIFAKMNYKRLKIWLIIFCVFGGGLSIYHLAGAIFSPKKKSPIKIDHVKTPRHFDDTGGEILNPDNSVDEQTFQSLQAFKKYMDSLKLAGSKEYDSIHTARPYLMDTVLLLEQIYYSQKQK